MLDHLDIVVEAKSLQDVPGAWVMVPTRDGRVVVRAYRLYTLTAYIAIVVILRPNMVVLFTEACSFDRENTDDRGAIGLYVYRTWVPMGTISRLTMVKVRHRC